MIYTLFVNPETVFAPQGANPIDMADIVDRFPYGGLIRHNVLYYKFERISLAVAGTALFRPEQFAASDWQLFMIRVVGTVKMRIVGNDWDGVTAISGFVPAYGTALYPGFAMTTVANVTSSTVITAVTASVIEAACFTLAADDDARLDDNA